MNNEYYYLISNSIVKLSEELTTEEGYHLGTTYADSTQGIWTPLSDDQVIFYLDNPSVSSREVFNMTLDVRPEPTPTPESELITRAIQQKVWAIQEQDRSTETFTVNAIPMWLDKNTRTSLVANTLPAKKAAGKTDTTLWYAGQPPIEIPVPIAWLESALSELELYAKATYDTTQQHIKAVYSLTTVEAIEAYDVTANYPVKLVFEITQIGSRCESKQRRGGSAMKREMLITVNGGGGGKTPL